MLCFAHAHRVRSFDDVEVLVLVRVNVGRRVQKWRQLLDHRESTAGGFRGGAYGNGDASERQDLGTRSLHGR
jgi:hypothetical protein